MVLADAAEGFGTIIGIDPSLVILIHLFTVYQGLLPAGGRENESLAGKDWWTMHHSSTFHPQTLQPTHGCAEIAVDRQRSFPGLDDFSACWKRMPIRSSIGSCWPDTGAALFVPNAREAVSEATHAMYW